MELRRRFAGVSRGRCLLTNLGMGQGAALRAAGNERRAGPVTTGAPFSRSILWKPHHPLTGEATADAES